MPYEILVDRSATSAQSGVASASEPLLHIRLTPHQSLSRSGFVTFISLTFVLMLVPLTAFVGTMLWWGLAPFVLATLALIWLMLKRSWRDGTLMEELRLWPERIEILRANPRGPAQHWHANPYWVRLNLYPTPVEQYLTLTGGEREVELGRFLTPEERKTLHDHLMARLRGAY